MKWGTILIFLYVFQLCVVMFNGLATENTTQGDLIGLYSNDTSVVNNTAAPTWGFIINPVNWGGTSFFTTMAAIMGVTGAIGIGLYLLFRSDLALLFGLFLWLLGLGAIPIGTMWTLVTSDVGMYACVAGAPSCFPAILAGIFTAGIIGFIYVLACLSWWTNRMAN